MGVRAPPPTSMTACGACPLSRVISEAMEPARSRIWGRIGLRTSWGERLYSAPRMSVKDAPSPDDACRLIVSATLKSSRKLRLIASVISSPAFGTMP